MLDNQSLEQLTQLADSGNLLCVIRTSDVYRITSGHAVGVGPTIAAALQELLRMAAEEEDALHEVPTAKPCNSCGVVKSLEEFPHDASRRDGRFHTCSACERVRWREKDRAKWKKQRAVLERRKAPGSQFNPGPAVQAEAG